jgi:hypothetical protein
LNNYTPPQQLPETSWNWVEMQRQMKRNSQPEMNGDTAVVKNILCFMGGMAAGIGLSFFILCKKPQF